MSRFFAWTAVLPISVLSACGGGGGGGGGGGPAPVDEPPSVSVTSPAGDVESALGIPTIVTIVYADDDPDSVATTDLVADLDGNPNTTGDQIPISAGRPEQDGATQSVSWNLGGVPAGTYRILALTSDTTTAVVGDAPGFVLVNGPPTLTFTSLAADLTVSRGSRVDVRYVDADADDAAMTWLYADRDGSLDTTGDLVVIAMARPETNGLQQTVVWDTTGVPFGAYRVIAMTWDGTNVPVTRIATGRVIVNNSSFANHAGGTGTDWGAGIGTFADGSSVVVGSFSGDATFGPAEAGETTLSTAGSEDVFLARYHSNGALDWAVRAGGLGADAAYAVCTFVDGSCVVTGVFDFEATFGVGDPNETTLSGASFADVFVARYAADGTLVWAKRAGTDGGLSWAFAIVGFPDGSVVVSGSYLGDVTFGPGEAGQTTLLWDDDYDVFVSRYVADGTLAWAKRASGTGTQEVFGIAGFPDGGCVITGYFGGSVTFGQGEANETTRNAFGITEVFVARYTSGGTLTWVAQMGGVFGEAYPGDVDAFADGSCVVTGRFTEDIDFGLFEPNETTFFSQGDADAFVARLGSNGLLAWAVQQGGAVFDNGGAVSARPDGSCVVAGTFEGWAFFGIGEPQETLLFSTGPRDLSLSKLDAAGKLQWVRQAGGTALQVHPTGMAAFGDGSLGITGVLGEGFATFGAGDNLAWPVASTGLDDVFTARYNADGGF